MSTSIKDQLMTASCGACQRAIRQYLNGEYDRFLMDAAHSLEQLGKARLASIHPSLIVDRDFDSFLHVCSASKHAKRPPWNIKTITATEVLARCVQLHPKLSDFHPRLKLLADLRNSAVHIGQIVEEERKEIFHTYLAATDILLDELGEKRSDYFGELTDLVATHLDESLADINRSVAEKIAHSKSEYQRKFGMLSAEHRNSIVKSIENNYDLTKYENTLEHCPGCNNLGVLRGSYDIDWEVDYDRDGTISGGYPVVTLTPFIFECGICELDLDGTTELRAAGMRESVEIEDVDPADFYGDPDY